MVFTCALKNLKGVVQDVTHQQMHQTDLAAAMMDLWSIIRPDITIADPSGPRKASVLTPRCPSNSDASWAPKTQWLWMPQPVV